MGSDGSFSGASFFIIMGGIIIAVFITKLQTDFRRLVLEQNRSLAGR